MKVLEIGASVYHLGRLLEDLIHGDTDWYSVEAVHITKDGIFYDLARLTENPKRNQMSKVPAKYVTTIDDAAYRINKIIEGTPVNIVPVDHPQYVA
jgi:hypothetical protein